MSTNTHQSENFQRVSGVKTANTMAALETSRRRLIRYSAATLSGVTALIYFMIGFNVVTVLDGNEGQFFGIFAGLAYAFGVLLLLRLDRRELWIIGAILQIFVVFTYFNLASQRSPSYEVWGILLRIPQLIILIALVYLARQLPTRSAASPHSR